MSLDMFRLDNRVALVTGASKGLGLDMAKALAEVGADVIVTSRGLGDAQKAARDIVTSTGRRALGLACDVTNRSQVEQTVADALAHFGQVDILVNNAGINIRKPITELSDEEWRQVMDTNLSGPFYLCRALAKNFMERRYGRVINIGSILSTVSIAGRTPYASSKGGLLLFTKTLALEWAPYGVTVNIICPGPFQTAMNESLLKDPEAYKAFIAKIPLGRWGRPGELNGAVVFLASDASSFVTGAMLAVDGGWTAQ
ncbi:MAG: glucose 1-dehydrogenase [Deinococcus sp.]|nr:glucose 1-dehydrogenase [Deinococcus sp.]